MTERANRHWTESEKRKICRQYKKASRGAEKQGVLDEHEIYPAYISKWRRELQTKDAERRAAREANGKAKSKAKTNGKTEVPAPEDTRRNYRIQEKLMSESDLNARLVEAMQPQAAEASRSTTLSTRTLIRDLAEVLVEHDADAVLAAIGRHVRK
jgi:transposase-like protein